MMDQELRRRELDIQRDLNGDQSSQSSLNGMSSKPSSIHVEAGDKRRGKRNAEKPSLSSRANPLSSSPPSSEASPITTSSSSTSASTSRTVSPTRWNGKSHKDRKGQSSSAGKQVVRESSRLDSSSDSRRMPSTGSSEAPPVESDRQLSKVDHSVEARQLKMIRKWIKMRESGADRHNQAVVANNQRLLELKGWIRTQMIRGLGESHKEEEDLTSAGTRPLKHPGSLVQAAVDWLAGRLDGDGLEFGEREDIEDEKTYVDNEEGRERERAQWKLDLGRLEADLQRERAAHREKDSRIQSVSERLEELLQLQRDWKEQLDNEKSKHKDIQLKLAEALTDKERELEDVTEHYTDNHSKNQKLTSEITTLNRQLQDLRTELRRQQDKAQAALIEQGNKIKEYQSHIKRLDNHTRELERRSELEQENQAKEDDEVRIHLRAQIQELTQSLQQKDGELQEKNDELQEKNDELQDKNEELQGKTEELQQMTEVLNRRQAEVKEIHTLIQGLEEQQRIEVREATREADERNQRLENEIVQLKQHLSERTSQLSQFNSSSNAAASTIQHLEAKVEEQESRIQSLEQELDLAQQQAQNVVSDLEQDINALENDCTKLENKLEDANRRLEETQAKAGDLEIVLGQKDQELIRELDQRQVKERQLLEKLLNDMEMEDQDVGQISQLTNENESTMDGSIRYIYSRLQERIRELRQGNMFQDELRQQAEQLQHDLAASDDIQRQLQHQLHILESQAAENAKGGHGIANGSVSSRRHSSSSRQQHARAVDQSAEELKAAQMQLQDFEERALALENEKQELLEKLGLAQDQIQEMEEDMLDRRDAVKDIRAKYTEKIESLKNEVVKHRKMVVKQEGQLFLYLSVIEKLKMQLRGDNVLNGSVKDGPAE